MPFPRHGSGIHEATGSENTHNIPGWRPRDDMQVEWTGLNVSLVVRAHRVGRQVFMQVPPHRGGVPHNLALRIMARVDQCAAIEIGHSTRVQGSTILRCTAPRV